MEKTKSGQPRSIIDWLQDIRVIRVVLQIIFVIMVLVALSVIWTSIVNTLQSRGLVPTFQFLERRAGFAINQSPEWYTSTTGTYGEAFLVGVMNTLNVVALGLVLSTILGVLLGIFLLSNNWLIKTLSRVYVEILRNTPLLVQLIFWYFVVMLGLPEETIAIPSEGVFFLWLRFFSYLFVIIGVWLYDTNVDNSPPRLVNGVFTGIFVAEIIFLLLSGDSWIAIIGIAVLGVAAYAVSSNKNIVPTAYEGLAKGAGILAVAQLVGHVITFFLAQSGTLPHPQLIYAEVLPSLYIRRQGVVAPAILTNVRFALFGSFLIAGLLFGWLATNIGEKQTEATGQRIPASGIGLLVFIIFGVIGWFASSLNAVDSSFAGLPQTGNVGIPTFNISTFILVLFALLAGSILWRNYRRIRKNYGASWVPFYIISAIFAGLALFLITLVVPFGESGGYITNFFWNTDIALQRETQNFPLFVAGAIVSLIAGVVAWGIARTLNRGRYDMPAVLYGVIVTAALLVMSFGIGNLPEEQILEIDGTVYTFEEALEQEVLPTNELVQFSDSPLIFTTPELNRFGRVNIGSELDPSYLALLVGLVIYTSAFIGEIVRAGIQAVPFGQIEASGALGLSRAQTLRMIILPQALRVIIPPMGNQYLNLAKNSSLALAIAYADTYQVGTTIMNQSGQSITGFALVLAVYLIMSLVISFVMNNINSRFQLVTR